METEFSALKAALAAGERVGEREFDLIFPKDARKFSRMHWTPVAAAVQAARWLVAKPGDRVLDVGSGAGKVCVIGALTTEAHFVGIERDAAMVDVAKDVVKRYRVPRVRFQCSDAVAADWTGYDSIYLFNPFANHVASETEFVDVIYAVTAKLDGLEAGTRVVTFHGFGGTMPAGFVQRDALVSGPGVLQLWEKV